MKNKKRKFNVSKLKILLIFLFIVIIASLSFYVYISSGYNHGRVRVIPIYGSNVVTLDTDIVTTLPALAVTTNSSLVVLNNQEYPECYGNWTVKFKTSGVSDLMILGENGTDYAAVEDNSTGELEVIQLRCGDNILFQTPTRYDLQIKYYPDRIFIKDYSCNETSYWTSRLLKCNNHKQKFVFGNSVDYANNACSGNDTYFLIIKDPDSVDYVQNCSASILNVTSGLSEECTSYIYCALNVTCQKSGIYKARVNCTNCIAEHDNISDTNVLNCSTIAANKFIIKDASGNSKAAFDSNGYFTHTGLTYKNQGTLTAPSNSFMVKNSSLNTVAYVDSNGKLYLTGSLTENQTTLTPLVNSFIIKDTSGNVVAYIDSSGNMVLKKYDYESWLSTI